MTLSIGCLPGHAPAWSEPPRGRLVPDLCRLLVFYPHRLLFAAGPPVLRENGRRSEVRLSYHD